MVACFEQYVRPDAFIIHTWITWIEGNKHWHTLFINLIVLFYEAFVITIFILNFHFDPVDFMGFEICSFLERVKKACKPNLEIMS